MALTRGTAGLFDYNRGVVLFSMISEHTEIPCAISSSALDDLEPVVRTKPEQREAQFIRLRDRIEACAAHKYEKVEFEGNPPGIVLRSIDFRPT